MAPLVETLLITATATAAIFVGLWIVGTLRRDVSVVDIYWGLGFGVTAWLALLWNRPAPPRVWLLAILTTVWGVRLAAHLLRRNWGCSEDRRYAAMRDQHGEQFTWVSLFTVFLFQAAILWFISWPLQFAAAARSTVEFSIIDLLGFLMWSVGFLFETVGDIQLERFRADPANRGRVLDAGLWRYTRHPNYFGDCCVWWGLYLIAVAGGAGWTIASPALMTFFLLKVSGVTLLERSIEERRPEYAEYRARTNAFFPGRPSDPRQT